MEQVISKPASSVIEEDRAKPPDIGRVISQKISAGGSDFSIGKKGESKSELNSSLVPDKKIFYKTGPDKV